MRMVEFIEVSKNNSFMSTSVISDISVYIYGNTECSIFIVDASTGDQTSVIFLECLTF